MTIPILDMHYTEQEDNIHKILTEKVIKKQKELHVYHIDNYYRQFNDDRIPLVQKNGTDRDENSQMGQYYNILCPPEEAICVAPETHEGLYGNCYKNLASIIDNGIISSYTGNFALSIYSSYSLLPISPYGGLFQLKKSSKPKLIVHFIKDR